MKKLLFLTAVFLLGTVSVFAQDAWEVYVDWNYNYPYDCTSQLSNEYRIAVQLDIYDVANSEQITDANTINYIDWDGPTETTFDETQTKVKDYCEESHDNTPSFKVTVTVAIVYIPTPSIYCDETEIQSGISCSTFFNYGVAFDIDFY